VSSRQSGSVRAIQSTAKPRLPPEKIKISGDHWKRNAVQNPKTIPIAANPTKPTVSAPKQGSILAGPTNTSAPNAEAGRVTGSPGGFDKQGPVLQGGGPGNQEGPVRDNAAFRDGGGATSSQPGTGVVRDNSTASRDGKSALRDNPTTSRDGGAASREKNSASRDTKGVPPDNTTTSRDGAATSRDDSTTSPDKAGGGSRDSTVAAKDGATGGPIKAEDIRRAIDRCAQTYVSYDRASMTYLDHNGDKQSCP
jgi:hypothetical protein